MRRRKEFQKIILAPQGVDFQRRQCFNLIDSGSKGIMGHGFL